MRYDDFAYLWPPRPDNAIDKKLLPVMEKRGMVAQFKLNGTCSVIFVAPDKKIIAMNRHNEDHRAWTPTDDVMAAFKALPGTGWYVFVAELMHNKVPGIKNVNYVHDILVNNGNYLVGATQEERQDQLHDLFIKGDEEETKSHIIINENLWLPVEYEGDFLKLFNGLDKPEYEGLVLKDPKTPLAVCSRIGSNNLGMLKCRKTHKNYSF